MTLIDNISSRLKDNRKKNTENLIKFNKNRLKLIQIKKQPKAKTASKDIIRKRKQIAISCMDSRNGGSSNKRDMTTGSRWLKQGKQTQDHMNEKGKRGFGNIRDQQLVGNYGEP